MTQRNLVLLGIGIFSIVILQLVFIVILVSLTVVIGEIKNKIPSSSDIAKISDELRFLNLNYGSGVNQHLQSMACTFAKGWGCGANATCDIYPI